MPKQKVHKRTQNPFCIGQLLLGMGLYRSIKDILGDTQLEVAFNFSPSRMTLAVDFQLFLCRDVLVCVPSNTVFSSAFIMKACWILSKPSSAYIKMIMSATNPLIYNFPVQKMCQGKDGTEIVGVTSQLMMGPAGDPYAERETSPGGQVPEAGYSRDL